MGILDLHLFGTFAIDHDGQHLIGLGRRKASALLMYLSLESPGLPHQRDKLAALLWPEMPQEDARRSLRQCIYQLRRDLRDHEGSAAHLSVSAQVVSVQPAELTSDVARFSQLCESDKPAELDEAFTLYKGELLAGFSLSDAPSFDEWLFYAREAVQRSYKTALMTRRAQASARQDWSCLIDCLRRLLGLDPLDEDLHRALMETYFANGERRAALDQYQACRTILKAELNLEPAPETLALFKHVKTAPFASQNAPAPVPPLVPQPTGVPETLTFLFTDIEDSTALWERYQTQMNAALPKIDAILRKSISVNNGTLFKTVGDAFYAVFARPADAVAATHAAQRALWAEAWTTPTPIRVRMSLHCGTAEKRENDYFGPTLNRTARILVVGHGGQILLSQATAVLVRDTLPANMGLQDMGERRLKDLNQPERIYQLLAPDLPADFPPLRTLDSRPTNLPTQLTAFIGRTSEVKTVQALLQRSDVRLATLTGPGGTGKTRLSLEIAAGLRDVFADGVFFVALAAITDPQLVLPAIAQALGVKEGGVLTLEQNLLAHVRDKHLLLVLDNFEQVIEGAGAVERILLAAPQVKVVVTSRIVLKIYGEHEYAVPTLALPDMRRLPSLEKIREFPAIALFVARAQAVRADFALSGDNAAALVEICTRLDGLPLAIELVAARSKLFSPQAMVSRLSKRLALVTGGGRTLPERQQTLRGAIRWSYDLLDNAERRLFASLSVFMGGCTIEAAEAVCGDPGDEGALLDGLLALVDKSLLRNVPSADGEPRFMMLETIREFAQECFEAGGEAESVRRKHANYFVEFTETAEAGLQSDQQTAWGTRMDQDHDNLRAALSWVLENNESVLAARLGGALGHYWYSRSHFNEGRRWLDQLRVISGGLEPDLQAKMLHTSGRLAFLSADFIPAIGFLEDSLELYRQLDDKHNSARVLRSLGMVGLDVGEYARAEQWLSEALQLLEIINDTWGVEMATNNMAILLCNRGKYTEAATLFTQNIARARRDGNDLAVVYGTLRLGCLEAACGNYARARVLADEALPHAERIENPNLVAWAHWNKAAAALGERAYAEANTCAAQSLAMWQSIGDTVGVEMAISRQAAIALAQGQVDAAHSLYTNALTVSWSIRDKLYCIECIEGLAAIAAARGDIPRAAVLWAAAASQRGELSAPLTPASRPAYDTAVDAAQRQINAVAWAEAWAKGATFDLEVAVRAALSNTATSTGVFAL